MARTKNLTIKEVTDDYLNGINVNNPPKPDVIQADIIEDTFPFFLGVERIKTHIAFLTKFYTSIHINLYSGSEYSKIM